MGTYACQLLRELRFSEEGNPLPDGMKHALGLEVPSTILSEFIPKSWLHSKGIHKVLRDLTPRMPNVSGRLFITFTVDPKLFSDPTSAYNKSRDRIRRFFNKLKHGVEWKGKTYRLDCPYCVKTEFHQNGFAHFHVLFLTKRFLPGRLINHLWKCGRTNVKRIKSKDFHYLLKYVTKGGGQLPEWVLNKKRIRIFQPSHGFLKALSTPNKGAIGTRLKADNPQRESTTIGQRLRNWARMAKLQCGETTRTCKLAAPFRELFDRHIFSIAKAGKYLGNGKIIINETKDIASWMLTVTEIRWLSPRMEYTCGAWSSPNGRLLVSARTAAACS